MLTDPQGRRLPTGVTYDPKRNRYRVRLYRGEEPVWLSYSRRYSVAMEQYRRARIAQDNIRERRPSDGRLRAYLRRLGNRFRRRAR
jgi:hypothetical protein